MAVEKPSQDSRRTVRLAVGRVWTALAVAVTVVATMQCHSIAERTLSGHGSKTSESVPKHVRSGECAVCEVAVQPDGNTQAADEDPGPEP
jgi:hypothetical protein